MPLTLKDHEFVQAYTAPNSPTKANATRSYKKVHPHVTDGSAAVLGHRKLSDVKLQAAVKAELSLDDLKREMQWCVEEAKKTRNLKELRGSLMDYGKLGGMIVDKSEVKNVPEEDVIRRAVNEFLRPSAS